MPLAPLRRLWEASNGDRDSVCGNQHLGGGGGLGGGGLHVGVCKVRVQRALQHVVHLQGLATKQHCGELEHSQLIHRRCPISLPLQ